MGPKPSWGMMHPALATTAPVGRGWLFEIKWDGARALLVRTHGRVRVVARSGRDVTITYPEIVRAVGALRGGDLVLDAELVALDADGRPNFTRLQRRMHKASPTPRMVRDQPVVAWVFDALASDGRDLRRLSLLQRKTRLRRLVGTPGTLRYVDHVRGRGHDFLAAVGRAGLEGMVAKRTTSPYLAGRSRDWLKVKCTREAVFNLCGFTTPKGSRAHLGALHLGHRVRGGLGYVGRVGSGLDDRTLAALIARLGELGPAPCPCTAGDPPRGRTNHWVRPELACVVRFSEWTANGLLRHPVFVRLV